MNTNLQHHNEYNHKPLKERTKNQISLQSLR